LVHVTTMCSTVYSDYHLVWIDQLGRRCRPHGLDNRLPPIWGSEAQRNDCLSRQASAASGARRALIRFVWSVAENVKRSLVMAEHSKAI